MPTSFVYLARMVESWNKGGGGGGVPVRLLFVKSLTNPFLLFFLFTDELFLKINKN